MKTLAILSLSLAIAAPASAGDWTLDQCSQLAQVDKQVAKERDDGATPSAVKKEIITAFTQPGFNKEQRANVAKHADQIIQDVFVELGDKTPAEVAGQIMRDCTDEIPKE